MSMDNVVIFIGSFLMLIALIAFLIGMVTYGMDGNDYKFSSVMLAIAIVCGFTGYWMMPA